MRRLWKILLSMTFMLLLVPAAAFADVPVEERVIAYPVYLSYSGADLGYHIGDYDVDGFFDVGNEITVTYSDGSSDLYICKAFENNEGYEEREYFLDGKVVQDETNEFIYEWFDIDYPEGGIKAGTTSLDFSCKYWIDELQEEKVATGKLPVKELPKPEAAKLIGELDTSFIGLKDLSLSEVAKPGNKIVITYTDGSKETYKCIKYKDGKDTEIGFFLNGDEKQESLWGSAQIGKGLKKGKNTVKFNLYFGIFDDTPLKVTVRATELYASVKYHSYVYTGRKITPKIVVKDGNGKTVPAKAYTVKYYNSKKKKFVKKPVGIKWGYYEYKVVFKKAYRNKYIDTVWGEYGIGPKGTTVTKATPGSNKITVKWKKKSGIDGYYIQYSRYKDFGEFYEKEVTNKNKTSAVIKGELKSKKTYYVRVCTFKKYKGMWVRSEPSKAKKVKVR